MEDVTAGGDPNSQFIPNWETYYAKNPDGNEVDRLNLPSIEEDTDMDIQKHQRYMGQSDLWNLRQQREGGYGKLRNYYLGQSLVKYAKDQARNGPGVANGGSTTGGSGSGGRGAGSVFNPIFRGAGGGSRGKQALRAAEQQEKLRMQAERAPYQEKQD